MRGVEVQALKAPWGMGGGQTTPPPRRPEFTEDLATEKKYLAGLWLFTDLPCY